MKITRLAAPLIMFLVFILLTCKPSSTKNNYKSNTNDNAKVRNLSLKLEYPVDNEKISTLSPTLKWNTIPGAAYELQLSKNYEDVIVKDLVTTGESWITYNLKDKTTYYWRVRYIKGYVKSDWSSIASFTIDIIEENLDCYGFDLGINEDYRNIMESNPHFINEYNSMYAQAEEIAVETGQVEIIVDTFFGPTIFRIYSTNDTVYMYTDLDESYNKYPIAASRRNQTVGAIWIRNII